MIYSNHRDAIFDTMNSFPGARQVSEFWDFDGKISVLKEEILSWQNLKITLTLVECNWVAKVEAWS